MDAIDWKKFYDEDWGAFRWATKSGPGEPNWYDPASNSHASPRDDWQMFMEHLSEDNPRAHEYLAQIVAWRMNRGHG